MEPEGSLPCTQEPSTGPHREPDQFNPYNRILSQVSLYSLKRFNITRWKNILIKSSKSGSIFGNQTCGQTLEPTRSSLHASIVYTSMDLI
jgi:hypothetical protein